MDAEGVYEPASSSDDRLSNHKRSSSHIATGRNRRWRIFTQILNSALVDLNFLSLIPQDQNNPIAITLILTRMALKLRRFAVRSSCRFYSVYSVHSVVKNSGVWTTEYTECTESIQGGFVASDFSVCSAYLNAIRS